MTPRSFKVKVDLGSVGRGIRLGETTGFESITGKGVR